MTQSNVDTKTRGTATLLRDKLRAACRLPCVSLILNCEAPGVSIVHCGRLQASLLRHFRARRRTSPSNNCRALKFLLKRFHAAHGEGKYEDNEQQMSFAQKEPRSSLNHRVNSSITQ